MSHRIIEKRRRDRMNNCLADLSRLIPAVYLKKVRPPQARRGSEPRTTCTTSVLTRQTSFLIFIFVSRQGRGRVEKTEIIEMAIKHLRHLQAHSCKDPSERTSLVPSQLHSPQKRSFVSLVFFLFPCIAAAGCRGMIK